MSSDNFVAALAQFGPRQLQGAIACLVATLTLACGTDNLSQESLDTSEAICTEQPDLIREWQSQETIGDGIREEVQGTPLGDENTFLIATDGVLHELDIASDEWTSTDWYRHRGRGAYVLTEKFILRHGASDHAQRGGYVHYVEEAEVWDREAKEWTVYDPPKHLQQRSGESVSWTGSELVFFGGNSYERPYCCEKGQKVTKHFDGALLNPETGNWRNIPAYASPEEYTYQGSFPTLRTAISSQGILLWGDLPNDGPFYGAFYDFEEKAWTNIDPRTGPVPRNYASVISTDDTIYYFRGRTSDGEQVRDLWSFLLMIEHGRQSSFPTMPLRGTGSPSMINWCFVGGCHGGSVYDPRNETWNSLSFSGNSVVVDLWFLAAANRVFSYGVRYHHDTDYSVNFFAP